MAMTFQTIITWDHNMGEDADFVAFTLPLLEDLVAAGSTDTINSVTTVNGDGTYTYTRQWDTEANANNWVSTVNSKTGYLSSTVSPIA